jgi:SAM-dependent methyltransferase
METLYEDKTFWHVFKEVLFDSQRLLGTPHEVESVLRLLKLTPPAHLLDLACGFGRHSLLFAEKGFQVTGVDSHSAYLEQAEKSSLGLDLTPRWVLSDMRDFQERETFDAVLSLYTSFGYFEEREEDERVLENAYFSLKEGGKILMDLPGKELIARDFIPEASYRLPSGAWFIARRSPVENWGRVLNEWTLLEKGKEYSYSFSQTLFSGYEISLFLHQAGFREVQLFGTWEGESYDLGAERLIAVGLK